MWELRSTYFVRMCSSFHSDRAWDDTAPVSYITMLQRTVIQCRNRTLVARINFNMDMLLQAERRTALKGILSANMSHTYIYVSLTATLLDLTWLDPSMWSFPFPRFPLTFLSNIRACERRERRNILSALTSTSVTPDYRSVISCLYSPLPWKSFEILRERITFHGYENQS